MEDKLRLNTKFFDGFNGVIGRRDFFLNFYVYINSLVILSTYPYILWMYKNVGSLNEFSNFMNINLQIVTKFTILIYFLNPYNCTNEARKD
jgi:hypothetical protein